MCYFVTDYGIGNIAKCRMAALGKNDSLRKVQSKGTSPNNTPVHCEMGDEDALFPDLGLNQDVETRFLAQIFEYSKFLSYMKP